ncbi:retinal-binding protein, partial [Caerostris extrusa]
MAPTNAKSLMKDFRASFRRKKVANPTAKIDKAKEVEEEERAKLAELKEVLGDALPPQIQILHRSYTDDILLSILRARSLNVKDAARLYVT